jgi:trimeric autotransporter adhesin
MKRTLLLLLSFFALAAGYSQITYYWVGGAGPVSFTANSNWNTLPDGSGTARSLAVNNDILIFSGSNIGGSIPATGAVTATMTANTIGQLKLINNAIVIFTRTGGSTGALTISDLTGDDLIVEAGSSLSLNSATANGNIQMVMGAGATGKISGSMSMLNTGQQRITNNNAGAAGSLVFTSGSSFTANVTSSSASYPFGSATQSQEKWVVFEAGANLYYEGGWSPMGNIQAFSAIDFKPGSNWYHRANNTGFGSFINSKSFGNIIVENNATLTGDGPVYRIGNLTINNGCSFTTHTSGQTAIFGDLTVNGILSAGPTSSNVVVMAGSGTQNISGAGTINIPSLTVANTSNVTLNKNITVFASTNIYGDMNFNTYQVSGAGTFGARVNNTAAGVTATLVAGAYNVVITSGTLANLNGLTVTGAGIAPNTTVAGFSGTASTIYLSAPAATGGAGVALTFSSDTAVLSTAHANGFDSTAGSVIVTGNKIYQSGTGYIINGATDKPFGISSGSTATSINAGVVVFNAAATTNIGATIYGALQLNAGKVSIRPLDTVRIANGATLTGNFNSNNYFITKVNTSTGTQGVLKIDNISTPTLFAVGSDNHYLPATITASSASDFAISAFQGITNNGTPNGTALTTSQKRIKVDAVWNINRSAGAGAATLQLQWPAALEGSVFAGFSDASIGVITNTGTAWQLPTSPGDNTANTASETFNSFGAFSIGSLPPAQSFVFNAPPAKTYGGADFDGGAFSLNDAEPIVYSSSNPAVATIVNGNIHITGAGNTNITASQASDGFYPAASVVQPLVVNKAALTIKADDKAKPEGDVNPTLTVTYTGFVYNETAAVLTTPVTITTTAVTGSPSGTYPIVPSGAIAANYDIAFVNGVLTVSPRQPQTITFNAPAAKTYGNADFAIGATSTNSTIPITYTSSNTNVATIVGNNIHIVGAGTATITAAQAGSALYFPAQNVARTLTVNKANLTVRAVDTTKAYGTANPVFRLVYTGFVLGQNINSLATAPAAATTAGTLSAPGYYSIDVSGGTSGNYNFVYTSGRLTIFPGTGTDQAYLQTYMSGSNTLTVKVYSPLPDLANVVLYDINGRPLLQRNIFLPPGFVSVDLNVPLQASGVYVIHVNGSSTNLKKMVRLMR